MAGIQPLNKRLAGFVLRVVEHSDVGILDLVGERKTEQDDLHNGHHDDDEQRFPVAENVAEFLSSKTMNCFISVGPFV